MFQQFALITFTEASKSLYILIFYNIFQLILNCKQCRIKVNYLRMTIMGPLSRPRSKILRVAVSRIILSSEASKVKLVGNLVA